MKNVISFKTLVLAVALPLGLAAPVFAGDDSAAPAPAPTPVAIGHGLLGQTYLNLGYTYNDFVDTSVNASTYSLALNQGVREGLDTLLEYSYLQSGNTGLGRINQQIIDVGARAFTNVNGFKPYAEAGLGGLWIKTPVLSHQQSFLWFLGVGVEFQATSDLSVTPFARLSYANSVTEPKQWDYGVRANYWLNDKFALVGTLSRDNSRDMSYGLGVNIRY
jgi:opacity protein-like surface antigen